MGSNVSRTVNLGTSRLFAMADAPKSPKDVVVEAESVNPPQETMQPEEARSIVPDAPEGEAVPMKVGTSPAPSLTPMTPEEETALKEPPRKKLRRQADLTALTEKMDQACTTMNQLSVSMGKMCDSFQNEANDLKEGLKALGLSGITNKGLMAALVQYEGTLRDISWQVSGSGKAQKNVSLKAAAIALGDKVTSVHQVLKEINKVGVEQHKRLMEQLSSLELAIKNLNQPSGPAVLPPGGFDAMPAFVPPMPPVPPASPAADSGSMASRPEMQSFTAMPMPRRQPDIHSVFNTPVGGPTIPAGSNAVPAAFQSSKDTSTPGQGSSASYARRAYRVVVQTGQGSTKVRAISPSAIRAVETPPPGWHQAYGLGDVVINGWRHRVLPDSFVSDAVQYPEI